MMKVAPLRKDTSNSTKSTSTERQRKQVSKLQEEELKEHQESVKHASTFDITLLGIAIVIGGQVFSWNLSLAAGFWEGFLGLMLTALGYLCLIFCISEMNSALPFSGGSYGFVRVCIGPFFGYVIGCCEALQNMAYVAAAVIPFGQMLTIALNTPVSYEPIWWTIFYLSAITLNIIGGSVFWKFNSTIGLISLLLIVIYILGTSQYGNFDEYSGAKETDDTISNDQRRTIYDYSFDGKGFITLFIKLHNIPKEESNYLIEVNDNKIMLNTFPKPNETLQLAFPFHFAGDFIFHLDDESKIIMSEMRAYLVAQDAA